MITVDVKKINIAIGVACSALFLAGCSVNADASETGQPISGQPTSGDANAETGNAAASTTTNNSHSTTTNEACQAGEFENQFASFVGSEAARPLYTMPVVEVATMKKTASGGYEDGSVERTPRARFVSKQSFPLRRIEGKYALSDEAYEDADWDVLLNAQFEFMNATDSWLVSFVPTRFDVNDKPAETYGDRQEWRFERDGNCWKLQNVTIYPGYGDK